MRLVRDDAESPHVVLSRDGDQWRVRGLSRGTERTLPAAALEPIEDESLLRVAADAVPTPEDGPLAAVGEREFGMIGLLARGGPQPVHALLNIEGICESDLHGLMGELGAADLVTETDVDGHRGYRATETATDDLPGATA